MNIFFVFAISTCDYNQSIISPYMNSIHRVKVNNGTIQTVGMCENTDYIAFYRFTNGKYVTKTNSVNFVADDSGIHFNSVVANMTPFQSASIWGSFFRNYTEIKSDLLYCPTTFIDKYIESLQSTPLTLPYDQFPHIFVHKSPLTYQSLSCENCPQWVLEWGNGARAIVFENQTEIDIYITFGFNCGFYGILQNFSEDTWATSSRATQCRQTCSLLSDSSVNYGWFSSDATIYIEFVIVIVIMSSLVAVSRRVKDRDIGSPKIGTGTFVIIIVLLLSLVSLVIALAFQGGPYLGNLVTTTLILLLALPPFFYEISRITVNFSYRFGVFMLTVSLLSWISLVGWTIVVIDHPFMANGIISTYLSGNPAASVMFIGVIPLFITSVTTLATRPNDVRKTSAGQIIFINGLVFILFILIAFKEPVTNFADVIICIYSLVLIIRYENTATWDGILSIAPFAFTISWAVAVLMHGIQAWTAITILHLIFKIIIVLTTNTFRYYTKAMITTNTFCTVAFAARYTYLIVSFTGTGFTVVRVLLTGAVASGALYLTQFYDLKSAYPDWAVREL